MHRAMLICGVLMAVMPLSATDFRYQVRRDKLWGSEQGSLTIGEQGIAYASENGKTLIDLPYQEIRKIDVADRETVEIWAYERSAKRLTLRRKVEFELLDGTLSEELPRFLSERLEYPVLGSMAEEPAGRRIDVYHRHVLRGCNGTLILGTDAVHFVSGEPKHDRSWPFEDIETIGSSDPFNLRITTYAETYNFDLKERLPEESYRDLWLRVFGRTTSHQLQLNKETDRP